MRIISIIVTIILLGAGSIFAFTDNGDDTVTDNRTGLVWQKQDDGTKRTWENAITYCEGLTLAVQSDWRLPNMKELRTIVDNTKTNPAINSTYFPNTLSSYYWSSTAYIMDDGLNNSGYAWTVDFANGRAYVGTETSNYVRCVRGGQ